MSPTGAGVEKCDEWLRADRRRSKFWGERRLLESAVLGVQIEISCCTLRAPVAPFLLDYFSCSCCLALVVLL